MATFPAVTDVADAEMIANNGVVEEDFVKPGFARHFVDGLDRDAGLIHRR